MLRLSMSQHHSGGCHNEHQQSDCRHSVSCQIAATGKAESEAGQSSFVKGGGCLTLAFGVELQNLQTKTFIAHHPDEHSHV